jgi:importin subunit alpha-6/7
VKLLGQPNQAANSQCSGPTKSIVSSTKKTTTHHDRCFLQLQRGAGRKTHRSRKKTALQIRKTKKDARLAKHRQMPTAGLGPMTGANPNTPMRNISNAAAVAASAVNLDNLPAMVKGVMGHDPSVHLEYTYYFRGLLSVETGPLIQKVIDSGVVPRFVEFLDRDDNPPLQFEAALALT